MTKEQATSLVLSCMHEVASTEARFAKEAQENDAYLGGPVFVRAPRRLSDAEVSEIVERRLQTFSEPKQAAETVPTAETERADIVGWLPSRARGCAMSEETPNPAPALDVDELRLFSRFISSSRYSEPALLFTYHGVHIDFKIMLRDYIKWKKTQ